MNIAIVPASSRAALDAVTTFVLEMAQSLPADEGQAAAELEIRQDLFDPPLGLFLLAENDDREPVGCVGLHIINSETAELSRFWVAKSARYKGTGSLLLKRFEEEAAGLGLRRVVLDTHKTLTSAIRLYRANGWVETTPYKTNSAASHWFEKLLT